MPILDTNQCLPPPRTNILGVGVSAINFADALSTLTCWIDERQPGYAVLATVYTIMRCQNDAHLRGLVNGAGLVTPDGMPLVWLARWFGFRTVERVYGPDLMLALSELAVQRSYRFFFYGGAPGVADELAAALIKRFPGLQIVGTHSPPFHALTEMELDSVIDNINAAKPDVVWIGLGSPKQDYWVAQHRSRLNAPVLIGVGAAFDIHAGRLRQAPRWMRQHALEWLFRLFVEPRRLWRRYLIYNPLFVIAIMLQLLGIRRLELPQSESMAEVPVEAPPV